MGLVAGLIVVALLGGALARWSRLNLPAVALIGAVPGGAIGLLIAMNSAAWTFALLCAVVSATAAALGAYLGWLRRTNMKGSI